MNAVQSRAGKPQIAVFGRVPRAGEVKTRLASAIGAERAAGLYRAFLEDTLEAVRRAAPGGTWLYVAPTAGAGGGMGAGASASAADARDDLAGALDPAVLPPPERRRVQRGDDLGARMAGALADLTAHGPALVVGSDAPDLPPGTLARAFGALTAADLVLVPTEDGGFALVGARQPVGDLFAGIAWSTDQACQRTLERAEARGLGVALLPLWQDVDEVADLAALAERLAVARAAGRPVPPRTARALERYGVDGGVDPAGGPSIGG